VLAIVVKVPVIRANKIAFAFSVEGRTYLVASFSDPRMME
jgi:hypothetical protein